jgi:flagellar protein FlbD
MITVTRLNGTAFALNPSLIERVECTPDTVLSLTTGTKYVVAESIEQVIEAIRHFQASILLTAELLRHRLNDETEFALHVVPDAGEDR